MTLYPPLFLEAVPGDTAITYHMQDLRLMTSALAPNQGTILTGDLQVTQRGAGANMSVDVASGRAIIVGDSIANQGNYIVRSDATYNVPISAASTSNPRIDLIVAQVYDKQADGGTLYSWTPTVVTGTPAASPVAPSLPPSAMALATVSVATNAASVTTTNITDQRILSGQGDIPQWDYSGTTGQSIPNTTDTVFNPSNQFRVVGMNTAGMAVGEFQCITPGRYVCHAGVGMPAQGTTGQRNVAIRHYKADGTTLIRIVVGPYFGNDACSPSAAGNFTLSAGDRVRATIYQASGSAMTITDSSHACMFTGVWIGP